jgi:hypothetical protein
VLKVNFHKRMEMKKEDRAAVWAFLSDLFQKLVRF